MYIDVMTPSLDIIADPTRRLILALLAIDRELCVCELVAALDEIQPNVSRNLALLRDAGWLISRREGTWMHYRLAAIPAWARQLVDALVAGGVPPVEVKRARARLKAFPGRPTRNPCIAVSRSPRARPLTCPPGPSIES
jgi:DNA-binding transcriptional ArsR family regulator